MVEISVSVYVNLVSLLSLKVMRLEQILRGQTNKNTAFNTIISGLSAYLYAKNLTMESDNIPVFIWIFFLSLLSLPSYTEHANQENSGEKTEVGALWTRLFHACGECDTFYTFFVLWKSTLGHASLSSKDLHIGFAPVQMSWIMQAALQNIHHV